ncbi:hypothetical protein BKA59DRAFT_226853 [Fusarium tricinctum]|uniref:Uncharacterized protein n=1 Tax=Fusarium tricinctum TaxID=61284 RepID=A0A8K0WBN1_9HYPO|nr:hypothetical protein BKA59DRAFT_226853 [Fusarium tricinctum]
MRPCCLKQKVNKTEAPPQLKSTNHIGSIRPWGLVPTGKSAEGMSTPASLLYCAALRCEPTMIRILSFEIFQKASFLWLEVPQNLGSNYYCTRFWCAVGWRRKRHNGQYRSSSVSISGGLGHSGTVDWMSDGFGRGGATLCRPALLRPCLELVLVANYQHCQTLSLFQDCCSGANQGIKTPSFTARSCALTRLSSLSLFGSVPIRLCH